MGVTCPPPSTSQDTNSQTGLEFGGQVSFLAVFILFLPSEIHRAKLEEKALAREFETKWDEYQKRTGGGPIRRSYKGGQDEDP